jgi:Fic family protein
MAGILRTHHKRDEGGWILLTPRHAPDANLAAHLGFALKWEGVNLAVLAALGKALPDEELRQALLTNPHGLYTRRAWFIHEWLTGRTLDIPAVARKRRIVLAIDGKQFALTGGDVAPRQRVANNIPGTREFAPLVSRTPSLQRYREKNLAKLARDVTGPVHPDIISRAAAFLLLSDSRASFAIENEKPGADRAQRWAKTIARAGEMDLSIATFEELQRIVIGDNRFVQLGLRTEGGFVGEHDRTTREPIPEHISARHNDLRSLLEGLRDFEERTVFSGLDPIVTAASLAFGFVYIHPFVDGNGRIHRWLVHHLLARRQFAPPGLIFPVSAAMLRMIDQYREVLRSYSLPLLRRVEWKPTSGGNVEVLNDTADWYRYFDATEHAEFLYRCVEETVERDLPEEVAYLQSYDRFVAGLQEIVDMPGRTADLLHRFLRQNGGRLSRRALDGEFSSLTAEEVARIEDLFEAARPRE